MARHMEHGDQTCETDLCVLVCGIHERIICECKITWIFLRDDSIYANKSHENKSFVPIECSIFISINKIHDSNQDLLNIRKTS